MANTLKIGRLKAYAETLRVMSAKEGIGGRIVQVDRGARYVSLAVRLQDYRQLDRALALAEPLAGHTYTQVVIAQRERGRLLYQFQLPSGFWESYTRADVKGLGVGLSESRRQIDYSFKIPHSLVGGATGSGKTEAVKSIAVAAAEVYKPEDLSMAIIDLKGDYREFDNLAHLALPIAHTQDEIDHAITWASQEMARRVEIGQNIRHQRLMIVIDEAENVLTSDREGRGRLAQLQAIARMGRAFDVNLVISTQEPQKGLVKDIKGQLLNRWIGWVESASTSYWLTGHAGLACHELTSEGDFMHVVGPEQERLQVALVTRQDYDRLPRAEIRKPEVELEDTPAILNVPHFEEPDSGGRPPVLPDPVMVARFRFIGTGKVSLSKAKEWFGMTRTEWERNRDFALAEEAEWRRLEELTKGRRNGR
jgi:hypothetical protein